MNSYTKKDKPCVTNVFINKNDYKIEARSMDFPY